MDLDPMFFVLTLFWLAMPAAAWLWRRNRHRTAGRRLNSRATTTAMAVYYSLIAISIVEAYRYPAMQGVEWPLLTCAWVLVLLALPLAVFIAVEDRLAWP